MSALIDLDWLTQLADPGGEGSVTLRTSVFRQLVAELKESRAQLLAATLDPSPESSPQLTPADRRQLLTIRVLATGAHVDTSELARQLYAYYRDPDRADRTPRPVLYLHLGLLMGALRVVDIPAPTLPPTTPN